MTTEMGLQEQKKGVAKKFVERTASWVAVLCVASALVSAATAQQVTIPAASTSGIQQQADLPDSPGVTLAKLQAPAQAQDNSGQSPNAPVAAQPPSPQTQSPQAQPQPPQRPVGTAAAEPTHAGGVAASQPAGVAIAPAKQRRVRTIVIRTAALIGAGVAVGTVVALTEATGSKPPGAH